MRLCFQWSGRNPGRNPTYFKTGPYSLLIKIVLIQPNISLFLIAWSKEGDKKKKDLRLFFLPSDSEILVQDGKHLLIAILTVKFFLNIPRRALAD